MIDKIFLKSLRNKADQIKELSEIEFKSDQESDELKQANKEFKTILNSIKDPKDLVQLEQLTEEAKEKNEPIDQLVQPINEKLSLEEAEFRYKGLLLKEKYYKTLLKTAAKQEEIDKLEAKFKEMQKEDQYFTTIRDKNGYYDVKKEKYQRRLKELYDQLDQTEGRKNRLKVWADILSLKQMKGMMYVNNYTIKTSKGVNKFSNFMAQIGESLSEIGKIGGMNNYNDKPVTKTKHKKHKKKKGKHRKAKQNKQTDDHNPYDYKNFIG